MPAGRMNQFKDLTLHYDAPAGFTFKIYANAGAAAATLARTLIFPASTGQRPHTLPLDNPTVLEAVLLKYRAESTGIVRLFAGVIRFRPIGVYFDGANGEVWETQELGFGI